MFQVVINKQTTEMEGTKEELLKGLCYYTESLNNAGISLDTIRKVFEFAIKEISDSKQKSKSDIVKTIEKGDNFTVQEINIEGLSGKEVKNILTEIFNKRK